MNQVPEQVGELLNRSLEALRQSGLYGLTRPERYRFVIAAWRLAKQARKELDVWTYGPAGSPDKYAPGELKVTILDTHIIGGKPNPVRYHITDLDKLDRMLVHGHDGKSAEDIFAFGWHFDSLETFTRNQIVWDKLHIRLVNDLAEPVAT